MECICVNSSTFYSDLFSDPLWLVYVFLKASKASRSRVKLITSYLSLSSSFNSNRASQFSSSRELKHNVFNIIWTQNITINIFCLFITFNKSLILTICLEIEFNIDQLDL